MSSVDTQEVKTVGELFTLPFSGENEVFSIYGNRDCNGDGKWDTAKHGAMCRSSRDFSMRFSGLCRLRNEYRRRTACKVSTAPII